MKKLPPPTCQWFALCEKTAVGVVEHPILEYVPTCQRCADKLGLRIISAEWVSA